MKKILLLVSLIFVLTAGAGFAEVESPYKGQEAREIKALSSDDVQGYLNGEGMGFAKAAELNHYPGPRHVLDAAHELGLPHDVVMKTREIYDAMHEEAVKEGELLIKKERELDELFRDGKVQEGELRALTAEIGEIFGRLRFIHLKTHLRMKEIMTDEQIEKYDEIRGYTSGQGHMHGQHGSEGHDMRH